MINVQQIFASALNEHFVKVGQTPTDKLPKLNKNAVIQQYRMKLKDIPEFFQKHKNERVPMINHGNYRPVNLTPEFKKLISSPIIDVGVVIDYAMDGNDYERILQYDISTGEYLFKK